MTNEEPERAVERLTFDLNRLGRRAKLTTVLAEDLRALLTERAELLAAVERMRPLLRECLGDYGHKNFTDRHGMADRIRAALTTATEQGERG